MTSIRVIARRPRPSAISWKLSKLDPDRFAGSAWL